MSASLFPLPKYTWQMTKEQLAHWQMVAMFECECENIINETIMHRNQMIELYRQIRQLEGVSSPLLELSAIDAAIDTLGLQIPNPRRGNVTDYDDIDLVEAYGVVPPAQRPRLQ